ncbi:MAG: MarR family transcriptional regulator [Mycobacterium sp.]|nr:MarR family transcriptional regulator [Mycobacterium sp.]MBV9723402.1 MarR family transcriptional regulator [Mycobacterium sp.]
MQARTELAADVFRVVGKFRRQLRRSVGRGLDTARLTESQSELLWLVGRRPGISVSTAAAELGLAANTASTLVSKLVSGGFLTRSISAADRRVCELALAEPTQQIVDASRAARRALLSEVIGELKDDQIGSLAKGLEVLDTMTRLLQERQS